MKQLFVSNEQALKLNELGFNEKCIRKTIHKKECSCKINGNCPLPNVHCQFPDCEIDKSITPVELPLFTQAFDWIRKNNPDIKFRMLDSNFDSLDYDFHHFDIYVFKDGIKLISKSGGGYSSDEIESVCLNKLIETLKNKYHV